MSLLGRTIRFLDARGVASALIGGAALAAHGVLRATLDSDVLVLDRGLLDEAAWEPVRAEGISVTVYLGDLFDPLAGVVRLRADDEEAVDVVVGKQRFMEGILDRRRSFDLEGEAIPIVEAADLVLLKLDANGTVDRHDIRLLLGSDADGRLRSAVEQRLDTAPERLREAWRTLA